MMMGRIALFVLFSLVFFFVILIFFAKLGYPIYAGIFQGGVLYEGETRAKHYVEYLLFVVSPVSMALGMGVTMFISGRMKRSSGQMSGFTR